MTWTRVLLIASLAGIAWAQVPATKEVDAVYPEAHALYLDIHQNPELSSHEVQTAAKLDLPRLARGIAVRGHVSETPGASRARVRRAGRKLGQKAMYFEVAGYDGVQILRIESPPNH